MFSDDTQFITKTEESIEETFKTLGIYEKASFEKLCLNKVIQIHHSHSPFIMW
jgi:hypothetical protein